MLCVVVFKKSSEIVLSSCLCVFTCNAQYFMHDFLIYLLQRKSSELPSKTSQTSNLKSYPTVLLVRTCMQEGPGLLPLRDGYISLSFTKDVSIDLSRLSLTPCRTQWGLCSWHVWGRKAQAIIVTPDVFLPSHRDVARAEAGSGAP